MYYWLQIEIKKYVTGGSGNPKLMSNVVSNIKIPIPSIKTQEKIVKILDKFTKYATELETELEKRIKQYNYYRDRLLSEEYLTKLSKKLWYKNELIFREYRIEEICEIVAGGDVPKNNFSKEKTEEYNIPVLSNGIEQSSIYGYTNVHRIEKPSITISARGTIGWANLIEEKFYPVVRLLVLIPKDEIDLNIKYLYYYTKVIENDYILPKTGIPQLTKDKIAKIKIYLPSLAIQNKVVKILDKFQGMLEDTKGLLPQEIELRRKQYEYYREKLLTFSIEEGYASNNKQQIANKFFELLEEAAEIVGIKLSKAAVEWKKIADIYKRQKGINITAKQMKELNVGNGEVKVFAAGETIAHLKINDIGIENVIKVPSVIVKSRGNIDVEYYEKRFTHKNEMWSYSTLNKTNTKYLYYVMKNNIEYFKSKSISGKLPQISTGVTDNFKILFPPLYVQEYVVSILDKFDTLVNDIKIGLPKEIEIRQKQYEYYREKLLNFKK